MPDYQARKLLAQHRGVEYNYWRQEGSGEAIESVMIDREKVIREIVATLTILEKCNDLEVENAKRFLRWMSDDVLLDMLAKHREALDKTMAPAYKVIGLLIAH